MEEPTIQDIVEIHGGYTSFVDLKLELFDDTRNIGRMSRYSPITSHRQAFQKLARSLNLKDNRCYLLTGAYGTGKSHLCLMFANYLQTPAGEQPMPKFFENYADVDPQAAEELKAKRRSGRYLIALCDWGGKGDFEEVVLRAVDEALRREGLEDILDTPYLQARKKIREWKIFAEVGDSKGHFYGDFERVLREHHPEYTLASFDKRLATFDYETLEAFKRIHQDVTTAPFAYDKADLLAILTSILGSKAFKDRFLGILVLFDEFGDTMERGNMSPKMFQQFAQLCAETPSNCAPIAFVGTSHKPLSEYAKAYNAIEFRTASDRIEQVPLSPNGVEDIVAAIVVPKKESMLWQQQIASRQTFDDMLSDCKRLNLFNWLKTPKIRETIIENMYPMHPMATFALLQLVRDVASNNRTIFTFFSDESGIDAEPGSYGHYIATTPIETGGKLNLYTANRLFDYFGSRLQADNKELRETVRNYVKDYESSMREQKRVAAADASSRLQYQEDLLVARILRLMLIYQIIQIQNTQENMTFGLDCKTPFERTALENRLRELSTKGILYYRKDQNIYEFKQSEGADIDHLVAAHINNPENVPDNLAAELNELVPLDRKNDLHLEAKDYNLPYGEDKRLERRFVRAIDLGGPEYFATLESEIEQEVAKKGEFEGVALYAICETADDIQKAKDSCARNTSDRIVIAIPKQPLSLRDAVLELRALQAIDGSADAKNFTIQDKAALNARLNGDGNQPGARKDLLTRRDKFLGGREVIWYGKYTQAVPTDESKAHDIANRVMEVVYASYRNKIAHDDFNKLHFKIDRTRNVALKEAVEKLLDTASQIVVDTSFAQARGDIRYLHKCLLNSDVLRVLKTDGTRMRCEFETNPDKYAKKLPSLAEMVREVQNLKAGDKIRITEWVKKYRKPPYGQGPVSLALSLACLCRHFGDSIRFKVDETAVGDLPVTSFDVVYNLIDGQYPNAFLSYRQLRSEEKALVNVVYSIFGTLDSALARDYTVVEAYTAMKEWWNNLPPLARVDKLYSQGQYPYTTGFIAVMQKIEAKDAHTFLFDELPTVFGVDAGIAISQEIVITLEKQLPLEKEALESALTIVEDRILGAVRRIFEVEQNTYSDIVDAIRNWYNSLDSQQRDAYARWQNSDSKPLILQLKSVDSLQDTFLTKISKDYGMRPVRDWISDRVTEYIERLERGKKHIDANRLKVESATIVFEGDYKREDDGQVVFKDRICLTFQHTNPGVKIYVAEGNADPTTASAQRQLVHPNEPLEFRTNKTLHIVVQDPDDNWSRIVTLQLINEHKKYEINFSQQKQFRDEMATIVFPTNPEAFAVTCRSLFKVGLERQALTKEQCIEIIQALVDELQREK